jgi:hypothetical protein
VKRPTFLEGVAVALVASISVGGLFTVLATLFASGSVLRILIAVTGLFYVLYLLRRSGEKVGRISSITLWLMSAALIWVMGLSLPLYLMAHLGIVWLIRSLYYYASLISVLADFALVLIGMAAAVWAVLQTGSLFVSVWCFFLVQALFVAIPSTWARSGKALNNLDNREDRFQNAYRVAEAALNKLSTRS